MDRVDTTELIANQFRISQTREKLKRENTKNRRDAIETHEAVGKEARVALAKIGGTPPENIPPAEPIKTVEKRMKKQSLWRVCSFCCNLFWHPIGVRSQTF